MRLSAAAMLAGPPSGAGAALTEDSGVALAGASGADVPREHAPSTAKSASVRLTAPP